MVSSWVKSYFHVTLDSTITNNQKTEKQTYWNKNLHIKFLQVALQPRGLLGIIGGGVLPSSPNPHPIFRPKNVIFHTHFQSWPLKSIHCTLEAVTKHKITCLDKTDVVVAEIKSATKRFPKIHFIFTYYTFFLGIETMNTLIHNHVPS